MSRRTLFPDRPFAEETITPPEYRLQHPTIAPQCLPDRGYLELQRIFLDDRSWPDTLHQVVFVDRVTRGSNQNRNDFKGAAANRDRGATQSEFPPREINLPVLVGVHPLLRHVAPPA